MKSFFIASLLFSMVLGSFAFATTFHLWGVVRYENGTPVGSGKLVMIYTSPTQYATDYTDGNSQYDYGFTGSQYFEKVACIFTTGGKWYQGITMIQETLTETTKYDIIVYEVQNPEEE